MGSNNDFNDFWNVIIGAGFVLIVLMYPVTILIGLALVAMFFILKFGFKILGKIFSVLLVALALVVQGISFVDKKIIKIV
jgi:hypothetical protein